VLSGCAKFVQKISIGIYFSGMLFDMSLFPTITVCTDFSPGSMAAEERAAQLAVEHSATLRLLHAFDINPPRSVSADTAMSAPAPMDEHPTIEAHTSQLRKRLGESAARLAQRKGLTVETVLGIGKVQVVVEEEIESQQPSLLVLGSSYDPSKIGLGGTATKLLSAPDCPVLVVRSRDATPYKRVLSGVDLRDGSVRAAVAGLALFPNAHHHLLYAVAPALDSSLKAGGFSARQVQSLHQAMRKHAERELHMLAKGLSKQAVHPVTADVADDEPARALLVGAASLQVDCVVVGHHDASTIGQSELGSMALHVMQFIPGDVLVVS
jgi:universal stress protein E